MNEKMRVLVDAVKDHARLNYSKDGWDYVVESWSDKEIAEEIGKARTPEGAIKKVGDVVEILNDHRADMEGYAW